MSNYLQKMYATLAGRVDTSIGHLVNTAMLGPCDKEHILKIAGTYARPCWKRRTCIWMRTKRPEAQSGQTCGTFIDIST